MWAAGRPIRHHGARVAQWQACLQTAEDVVNRLALHVGGADRRRATLPRRIILHGDLAMERLHAEQVADLLIVNLQVTGVDAELSAWVVLYFTCEIFHPIQKRFHPITLKIPGIYTSQSSSFIKFQLTYHLD